MTVVRQIAVGTMLNLVYLLADRAGGEGLVVDSGWETKPIVEAAKGLGVRVRYAVATHNHFDHTSTLKELSKELGAEVVAHERSPIEHAVSVRDGDVLQVGQREVRILHTPGHTQDSICLYDGESLFTGDTLFIGNCGRTDLPGGSMKEMFRSLREAVLRLPPSTMIYPGHDYGDVPSRRLAEEALSNPTLSARSYEEFAGVP